MTDPHASRAQPLRRVSPHVYWLAPNPATDRPVLGVVAGEDAVLIVDAGNSPAHANLLLERLAEHDLPAVYWTGEELYWVRMHYYIDTLPQWSIRRKAVC